MDGVGTRRRYVDSRNADTLGLPKRIAGLEQQSFLYPNHSPLFILVSTFTLFCSGNYPQNDFNPPTNDNIETVTKR